MIDKEKFATGLGLLANNFNRTVDGALSRVWYRTLSERLTTEQFEQAVLRSIAEDTFWPTAASLIAKVAAAAPGLEALEHVGRVTSKHGGYRFLPHVVFHAEFDAPTRAAISAVGGLMQIAMTTEERWPSLQKRFSAAYAKALEAPAALPESGGAVRSLTLISGKDRAAGMEP